jgi:hypothetical protein
MVHLLAAAPIYTRSLRNRNLSHPGVGACFVVGPKEPMAQFDSTQKPQNLSRRLVLHSFSDGGRPCEGGDKSFEQELTEKTEYKPRTFLSAAGCQSFTSVASLSSCLIRLSYCTWCPCNVAVKFCISALGNCVITFNTCSGHSTFRLFSRATRSVTKFLKRLRSMFVPCSSTHSWNELELQIC